MFFLKIITALKKFWVWCKTHWKFVVGFFTPIILFLIFRKKMNHSEVLARIKEDHQKEIKIINDARDKEISAREEALIKHEERMKKIEEEFAKRSQDLDAKKKKQLDKLLKEYDKKPEEITLRISKITGFEIFNK